MADAAVKLPCLQEIRQRLARHPFSRNVAVLAGGSALGQSVVVVSTPIIARLYTPADFGVLTVMTSVLAIAGSIATLRYHTAIPVADSDEDAAQVLGLSVAVVTAFSLLSGLAVLLAPDQIARCVNVPTLRPYLWFLPLSLLGAGLYETLKFWAIRRKAFGRIARTSLHRGLGSVLTKVILGLLKVAPLGLLWGNLVASTSGVTTLGSLAWRHDGKLIRRISLSRIGWAATRFRRFPLISTWSSLLQSAGLQLPVLLLASAYGSQMIGAFGLAQRIVTIPMTLIGDSVGNVYFGEAGRLGDQPQKLLKLCHGTARRLFLIGILPCALFVASAPLLFTRLFGRAWQEAGAYSQLLALMIFARFVVVPVSRNFAALERQDLLLLWDIARLVLVAGSLTLGRLLGLSALPAVALYSAGMILSYVVQFLLSTYAIKARIRTLERTAQP